jgi:hypothetical protein
MLKATAVRSAQPCGRGLESRTETDRSACGAGAKRSRRRRRRTTMRQQCTNRSSGIHMDKLTSSYVNVSCGCGCGEPARQLRTAAGRAAPASGQQQWAAWPSSVRERPPVGERSLLVSHAAAGRAVHSAPPQAIMIRGIRHQQHRFQSRPVVY